MRKQRGGSRSAVRSVWGRRVLAGAVAIGIATAATAGAAYADTGLKGKILAWIGIQTDAAISSLDTAIAEETELQKQRVQAELRENLRQQAADIQQFTEQEKTARLQEIRSYADELLRSRSFDSVEQKQEYASRLNGIVNSALSAMDGLDVPAAAPTVTGEVYNGGQP